jgi:hypothetical protein
MSITTMTPITVTGLHGIDLEDVERGLRDATSGIVAEPLEGLPDDHPAGIAFDRDVLDAAVHEVRREVAQLLLDAVERRLPWEWPG